MTFRREMHPGFDRPNTTRQALQQTQAVGERQTTPAHQASTAASIASLSFAIGSGNADRHEPVLATAGLVSPESPNMTPQDNRRGPPVPA
jgi:hypothetical protein